MIELVNSGLSIIPVKSDKRPLVQWDTLLDNPLTAEQIAIYDSYGFAMLTGYVEVIDVDLKYDDGSGLMSNLMKLISSEFPEWKQMFVVQSTMNNGIHIVYKCEVTEGNLKLASRYANEEELKDNPKNKIRTLIETRGKGGYVLVHPTPGYKLLNGSLTDIPLITAKERGKLLSICRSFNRIIESVPIPVAQKDNFSIFDDYNLTTDGLNVMISAGWQVTKEVGFNKFLKRPGSENDWGATYHTELRILYVFTSSSEFEQNKGYSNSYILYYLEANKDWKSVVRILKSKGFVNKFQENKVEVYKTYDLGLAKDYIKKWKNGDIKPGLRFNIPSVDAHWLIKPEYVVFNGYANTGKTTVILYLIAMSIKIHHLKWVIWSQENKTESLIRKMAEFLAEKTTKSMDDSEIDYWVDFIQDHTLFLPNYTEHTIYQYLEYLDTVIEEYFGAFADPFNAFLLPKNTFDKHQYVVDANSAIQRWCNKKDKAFWLSVHTNSESARRKDKDGYTAAPFAEDTDNGVIFVNKCNGFVTIHRKINHPDEWRITDIHIRKVKETETGGMPTFNDAPIKLKMMDGSVGFLDMNNREVINEPIIEPIKPNYKFDVIPDLKDIPF